MSDSCEHVLRTNHKKLCENYGTQSVWIAYCGNGPAHGVQSGHYPLYQGPSQNDASAVGLAHLRETGHQTYVWHADS